MSVLVRFPKCGIKCLSNALASAGASPRRNCSAKEAPEKDESESEFRVLKLLPTKTTRTRRAPREYERVTIEDCGGVREWSNFWTGPKSFLPGLVPLPVRQGYGKDGIPLQKHANAELMKIPNFLHLTPPAVEKHCKALRRFCTNWPDKLQDESDMEKHFPITIIASDYCHSSPKIRDPLSRIITLKVKLQHLELDKHARDKFLRLVGGRYDPKTDEVTITVENCPLKKQNYDYAMYILTALYYESWKEEDWEKEKTDEDMEEYVFDEREMKRKVESYFAYDNRALPNVTEFASIVERFANDGDDEELIRKYRTEVLALLELPAFEA